eukprot:10761152-Lingulodinium_polyedra.AAC.1
MLTRTTGPTWRRRRGSYPLPSGGRARPQRSLAPRGAAAASRAPPRSCLWSCPRSGTSKLRWHWCRRAL